MSAARKSPAKGKLDQKKQFYHHSQQHQSWDETKNTAVNVPTCMQTSPPSTIKTPTRAASSPLPYKCPKSPRNFHVPYDSSSSSPPPPPPRSPSARSTYSAQSNYADNSPSPSGVGSVRVAARSCAYDNPPRSPKITTTNYSNDSCEDVSSSASYYQTPTSGSRCSPKAFSTSSTDNSFDSPGSCGYLASGSIAAISPRLSPNKTSGKFVFDAISPSNDQPNKKFEYYEPMSPEDNDEYFKSPLAAAAAASTSAAAAAAMQQPSTSSSQHIGYEPLRRNSQKKIGRTIPAIDMIPRGFISCGDSGNSANDWELPILTHIDERGGMLHADSSNYYLKRDSCVTESTQLSMESNDTATNSTAATTTTSFSYSDHSSRPPQHSIDHSGSSVTRSSNQHQHQHQQQHQQRQQRRHAINITSNPGYQVLHSSHSTLDRTCSDSVVSLRYRKSTSDLTATDCNDKKNAKTDTSSAAATSSNANQKHRRRGSSKGGLAYLASRRSSRDSMKSACSNTSIFSNDDIGPLAFQASNRGRQRRTSNFLELPVPDHVRPRVCSLPDRPYNPRASDDLYRLRHFSISKGNVVNCGDSIISRRSRSNTSVNSTNSRASERSPFDGSCCGGGYANVDSLPVSPDEDDSDELEPPPPQRYRVVMLGDAGVGKTALVNQFMTSEYMHTYDASLDDEFGEKTVSVLLDDEESELVFIDHPSVEMSVENSLSTYEPHGCVIVFSVVDKSSFRVAEEIINYLWQENYTKDKAVILVGNKADLARARVITAQDGKSLAASRDAKFIETSSGIQHNVDELLVGILKQMRLKGTREKKATSSKMKTSRTHISLHMAKEFLQKICLSDISKSKSCENLHVL